MTDTAPRHLAWVARLAHHYTPTDDAADAAALAWFDRLVAFGNVEAVASHAEAVSLTAAKGHDGCHRIRGLWRDIHLALRSDLAYPNYVTSYLRKPAATARLVQAARDTLTLDALDRVALTLLEDGTPLAAAFDAAADLAALYDEVAV